MTSTILVVDDEDAVRRMLARALDCEGYRVVQAVSSAEALACIETECPDLVLADVMMPGIDGIELCRRLKADPRTRFTPVVLVTGLAGHDEHMHGIEAGADDFLAKPIDLAELKARTRSLLNFRRQIEALESAETVILSLARTIEARDPCTSGHCERLAAYATALGAAIGLSPDELQALHDGGYVHDLGKIAIPDAVLQKPGALTAAENAVMRTHPEVGDALLAPLHSMRRVRPIVLHHHERFDGSGYPTGLAGDAVPLLAQIMGIVDVYDALTTDRPYRAAMRTADGCRVLAEEAARGLWRTDLVEAFIRIMERRADTASGDTGAPCPPWLPSAAPACVPSRT